MVIPYLLRHGKGFYGDYSYISVMKSTISGIACLIICLGIYVPIEFFGDGVKLISVSSFLIGFFALIGVAGIFGKDDIIDSIIHAILKRFGK